LVKNEKDEFLPWYLMDKKDLLIRCKGLKERYPARTLFPFARHDMCDDIACWEKEKPGKVVLLHDYASPGWENRMEFSSFEEWYQYVLTLQEEY
jgi:hypothetical protein